jgi:hypothetical protein
MWNGNRRSISKFRVLTSIASLDRSSDTNSLSHHHRAILILSLPHCSRTATLSLKNNPVLILEKRNRLLMKMERKNLTLALDTDSILSELERTMVASIALMKRLRRERRRSIRIERSTEEQSA